jgi:arginine decarboxylase
MAEQTHAPPAAAGLDQSEAPYLDALVAYAAADPARLHVPGHKGGPGADPGLRAAFGDAALALDIPALMHGIDAGVEPTPFARAQELAAAAWGARRSWFLVNGASQGNHVACLALAHLRAGGGAGTAPGEVVVQRNCHSSTIDGLVLSGLLPTFVAPELDPELGIAHCLAPEALEAALERTPGALGALVVSPTYFGAVADVAALAEVAHARGVPLVVDEAWGAHLAFHDDLPAHALACGADLVVTSVHKVVGSLTQSAIVHTGPASPVDDRVVDRCVTLGESTSPNALLAASLDAARRQAATRGRELLGETLVALREARAAIGGTPGLDVLDERIAGRPGVHAWDPLRLAIDVRGSGLTGYELEPRLRERGVNLELYGENVVVALFGMAERALPQAERLLAALRDALGVLDTSGDRSREAFAPPPPWGELAMTPREAFLAPQEVVPLADAAGRIAAESLAAYPPGIPNVLPGERLTRETLDYVRTTVEQGGSVRGASDRGLRTLRVVCR